MSGSATANPATPRRMPVPEPGWIVVMHPSPEVAASRAAVVRRAFDPLEVLPVTRGIDTASIVDRRGSDGLVLLHLDGLDRFRNGWSAHRLLSRLAITGRAPVVAWVDVDDVDGQVLATDVGATGTLLLPRDPEAEHFDEPEILRDAIDAARRGENLRWDQPTLVPSGDTDLAVWFERRYGEPWQPWMEHAVALVVGGGERTEQAELLRLVLSPSTMDHARRRLRLIGEILCGEIRGNESVLRNEGLVVLRRIGRGRRIAAEPFNARSMQQAAAAIARDERIAREAGIGEDDARDLVEVAREERSISIGSNRRRGRPEAGTWRLRRELALGRVAERRGGAALEKLTERDRLRASVDHAIHAVHDALADHERTPIGARSAA